MARTCRTSAAETAVVWSSFRFRLLGFDVRIWRAPECPRIILPVAVKWNRLAAPLCVFSLALGKSYSLKDSQSRKFKVNGQTTGFGGAGAAESTGELAAGSALTGPGAPRETAAEDHSGLPL